MGEFFANIELLLMLCLPLFGAVFSYLIGKKYKSAAGWIATTAMFLLFFVVVNAALPIIANPIALQKLKLFEWIHLADYNIDFALRFDYLSALMALIISGVGSLIHLYSIAYMHSDKSSPRYFAYLNLFIFFMMLLVLGDNLLVLFAGWEGVGLCSYLLIGFWFKNLKYAEAGKKAFIVNRIGDAGFLLAIFALMTLTTGCDFATIESWVLNELDPESSSLLLIAAVGLFIGVTGKSAQIPLFVWLPDAMAGPTPVSALIHAATMVTAGIYLLARMDYLFPAFPNVQYGIFIIAFATAALAGLIALFQNDLKKILAYSTVSQLGFMLMASSAGLHWVALFHVASHALFKAGLFLSAGNIIHACHGEQDLRKMGGLWNKIPTTFVVYLICTLAISGIYPTVGFFSKHEIMSAVSSTISLEAFYLAVKVLALLTVCYMVRSLVLVFFGAARSQESESIHANSRYQGFLLNAPIAILGILTLVGGTALLKLITGLFQVDLADAHYTVINGLYASALPLAVLVIAGALSFFGAQDRVQSSKVLKALSYMPRKKFFIDEIYQLFIIKPLRKLSRILSGFFEQAVIDHSIQSAGVLAVVSGFCLQKLHSGGVRGYLISFVLSAVFLVSVCLLMI